MIAADAGGVLVAPAAFNSAICASSDCPRVRTRRSAQPASRPRRLVHVAAMSTRVATGTPSSLFGRHLPDKSGQSSIDPRPNGARWALRAGAGTMVCGLPRELLNFPAGRHEVMRLASILRG